MRRARPETFSEAPELEDRLQRLIDHRSIPDEDATWLAHAVATACVCADYTVCFGVET